MAMSKLLSEGLKSAIKAGSKGKAIKKVKPKKPSAAKLKRMDAARKKGSGALMREGLSDLKKKGAVKSKRTTAEQKRTGKPETVISTGKTGFAKAVEQVKSMNLKPETRNRKLIDVYKKYGRKVPSSLIKPVGRKGGGTVASKKKGGAPHNRLY